MWQSRSSRDSGTIILSLTVVTLLFSIFYLQGVFKWWFEDDPDQYAFVANITNPLDIFFSPGLMRSFGAGASAAPMQLFSYWLDIKLFGVSPFGAYLHNLLSLLAVTVLLYLVSFMSWSPPSQVRVLPGELNHILTASKPSLRKVRDAQG